MRIAFLMYGIPQNGGTKVLFRVGSYLLKRNHEVTYFVPEPQRSLPFPSQCKFVFANKFYPNAIGRVKWLSRVPIEADVTIATFHATAFALHWNRSRLGRKLYYVQAYEPEFYSDSMGHMLRRWPMMLLAGASYLLPLEKMVNCEGSRKGLSSRQRSNAPELPPGIDLSIYHPRFRNNDVLTVGHISRREWWKGSDYFFRAMKELRARGHKLRVRVAYDLWPQSHGIEYETVCPRTEEELAEYYAGLDVLVSTVVQKGFGFPPLESMASGTLCVSTPMDFGNPWVDHIPIIANSAGSIVDAIKKIDEIDRAAYIRAGVHTAAAYSWDVIGERWNALLNTGASEA